MTEVKVTVLDFCFTYGKYMHVAKHIGTIFFHFMSTAHHAWYDMLYAWYEHGFAIVN